MKPKRPRLIDKPRPRASECCEPLNPASGEAAHQTPLGGRCDSGLLRACASQNPHTPWIWLFFLADVPMINEPLLVLASPHPVSHNCAGSAALSLVQSAGFAALRWLCRAPLLFLFFFALALPRFCWLCRCSLLFLLPSLLSSFLCTVIFIRRSSATHQ